MVLEQIEKREHELTNAKHKIKTHRTDHLFNKYYFPEYISKDHNHIEIHHQPMEFRIKSLNKSVVRKKMKSLIKQATPNKLFKKMPKFLASEIKGSSKTDKTLDKLKIYLHGLWEDNNKSDQKS